jgi:hypothetical protein
VLGNSAGGSQLRRWCCRRRCSFLDGLVLLVRADAHGYVAALAFFDDGEEQLQTRGLCVPLAVVLVLGSMHVTPEIEGDEGPLHLALVCPDLHSPVVDVLEDEGAVLHRSSSRDLCLLVRVRRRNRSPRGRTCSRALCTYMYANTTCLSTLIVTYSFLLLAVPSSKMCSLPTK